MIDVSKLPYPIASLYQEMHDEKQPGMRFRSLVRAFSGFLKFVSLLAVSDYLLADYEDPAVDELLSGPKLKRPSLGHWNEFLREILQFHMRHGSEPGVHGLLDFCFNPGKTERKQSRNVVSIDKLITLRNEYVHPDIWPSDAAASRLYEQHIGMLDGLYTAASFLAEYRFIYQKQGRRLSCHGPDLSLFRESESRAGDPEGFFIEKEGERPLAFMAFLLFDDTDDGPVLEEKPSKDIMLYESRTAKWIKYLRGNHLRYRKDDAFVSTNEVLARLTRRLARNDSSAAWHLRQDQLRSPQWDDLYNHCKAAALKLVGFHITEKKFNPNFYLSRAPLEEAFARFINGGERICLLVGDSGCGKTNLLCHLTDEYVTGGHSVLHYYGRNFDGGSLLSAVAADLVSQESELLPYLSSFNNAAQTIGGKKMLLFFDAINEYTDAPALFRNILDLEEALRARAGIGFHKIIISMRSATWELIDRSFNFTRGRFFFSLAPGEPTERPRIWIGPFDEDETRSAYHRYALSQHDNPRQEKQKTDYGVRLNTTYEALPVGIRQLISNPIFLRYLVTSYESVTQELTEADILVRFYNRNIPSKHRYFLLYFLEVLWFLRKDFLTEDDLHMDPPEDKPPIRRALTKLLEYCYEDTVDSSYAQYVCYNNDPFTNTACRNYGVELGPEHGKNGYCPRCGQKLTVNNVLMRSTFFFMVDEGIVSSYQTPGESMLLRFTYDRFFEIMMARHLMHVLARDSKERVPAEERMLRWLDEVSELPIYTDVMAYLLAMVHSQRVVDESAEPDGYAQDQQGSGGVLYRLEPAPPGSQYEELLNAMVERSEPRLRALVHRALVLAGRDPRSTEHIHEIVLRLSSRTADKSLAGPSRLAIGQLSLGVATDLGLRKPFLIIGRHSSDKLRALAVAHAYFFWKKDTNNGLTLLSEIESSMYGPLSIPRLKTLEFFVGLCVLLLFRHPTESNTVEHILRLLRLLLQKAGIWFKAVGLVLPPLFQSVLRDIPSDYNPVNLEELRRGKKDIAGKPELRNALLDYARFLRQETVDTDRQRIIIDTFRRLSPKNNMCYLIHQLVQAFRASYDLRGAVISEVNIAMESTPDQHMWIQGPLYTVLWLTSGVPQLDDETFGPILRLWRKIVDTQNFAYEALVPGSSYHNWSIYYFALTLLKQSGGPHLSEVRMLFDRLHGQEAERGIYAFFRGIDIVGAELSSIYPDALRLVHATIEDLLNGSEPLPQRYLDKLAATLERIRILSYDEAEAIIESVRDRVVREKLRKQMAAYQSGKNAAALNIGTLAGAGGQDFYLHAMADRDLRLLFADLMELFVTARSLGSFVSGGIDRLRRALTDRS